MILNRLKIAAPLLRNSRHIMYYSDKHKTEKLAVLTYGYIKGLISLTEFMRLSSQYNQATTARALRLVEQAFNVSLVLF